MNERCYANSTQVKKQLKKARNLAYLGQCLFPIKGNNA